MLPFTVHIVDGVPVSDQIIQAVRKALLTGQLRIGDIFPSVRALSQELKISPTTAHKVVATLRDEGFLGSRPGIGMVITVPQYPSKEERMEHIKPLCLNIIHEAADLGLDLEDVIAVLRQCKKSSPDDVPAANDSNKPVIPHETDH